MYISSVSEDGARPTVKPALIACLHGIFSRSYFPHEQVLLSKSTRQSIVSPRTKKRYSSTGCTKNVLPLLIRLSIFFSMAIVNGFVCFLLRVRHSKNQRVSISLMLSNKGMTGYSLGVRKAEFIDSAGFVVLMSYLNPGN